MGSEVTQPPQDDMALTPQENAIINEQPVARPDVPIPTMRNPDQPVGVGPLGMIPDPPPEMSGVMPRASAQGGQGFLGSLGSFMTKPPANTRPGFGETQGYVPAPSLGMALPPAASLLGRTALQGGAAGLEAALGGKGPLDVAKEAGKGAAFNVGAEGLLGPLARFISRQGAPANAANKLAHDTAMTGTLNATEQAAHQTAVGAHAEGAAQQIAQDLIDKVPALKGTVADGKGLYDAIYGAGKDKVSAAFDQSLKDVVAKGAGQVIHVPAEIAAELGLNNAGAGVAGLPANVQALFNKGAQKAGMTPAGQPGMIGVDAAEAAKAMVGKSGTAAYRAIANALDAANIGDPAARAAYKAHAGISEFINKSKALDANGNLNPEKLMKAFSDLKSVNMLRGRGLGSGTEGAIQEAARGGPLAPTPREIPSQANDISSIGSPFAHHPYLGYATGGALGGLIGHAMGAGPLGHAMGAIGGAGVASAIPKQIVTKGPLSEGAKNAANNLPDLAGILARLGLNKVTST